MSRAANLALARPDRRSVLAGLAAAATIAAAPRARAAKPDAIRIGFQKNGPFLVAKTRGVVEQRFGALGVGVEWREFQFGPPLVEALNVGAIDLGSVGDTPPIFAQAARSKFVYAATHASSACGVIVPKGSPIASAAELKGKRISIPKGSSAHNVAISALEKAGVSFKDVEPVYLAPADGQAAFARGAVDAWSIWDPYFALTEISAGAKLIALGTDVSPQFSFALASRSFAEAQPDLLAAALEEIGRAGRWSNENREEAARLFSEATGVAIEVQRRVVSRANYEVFPLSAAIVDGQQKIADRFHALGLIPAPIAVAENVWRPGA